jgi:hypothetical protein
LDFNFHGYELKFIQRDRCKDSSAHIDSHIFKFFSIVTKYHYIIRAEYHEQDVFAVKFYCKKDRKSDYKYSRIINKGDVGNIVISCLNVVPILLQNYPTASFGFIGARTYDPKKKVFEPLENTQRFKVWSYVVERKIGINTFKHLTFPQASGYLLLNRNSPEVETQKEDLIKGMFLDTYSDFPDLFS